MDRTSPTWAEDFAEELVAKYGSLSVDAFTRKCAEMIAELGLPAAEEDLLSATISAAYMQRRNSPPTLH